jgi:hypothetical protein
MDLLPIEAALVSRAQTTAGRGAVFETARGSRSRRTALDGFIDLGDLERLVIDNGGHTEEETAGKGAPRDLVVAWLQRLNDLLRSHLGAVADDLRRRS